VGFLGWNIAEIATLFAGTGAFVVALYFLRKTRRRMPVAAMYLWTRVLPSKRTAALLGRLTSLLSLILALLVLAALAFALGDPTFATERAGTATIFAVDTTASMGATDETPTRLAYAVEIVRRELDGFGIADEGMIVVTRGRAAPLTSWSKHRTTLLDALGELREDTATAPITEAADHNALARFALDAARGHERVRLVFVSDTAFAPNEALVSALAEAHVTVETRGVGTKAENLGVTHFSARRYPLDRARAEVLVTWRNPTPETRRARAVVLGDGEPIDVYELELPAGESSSRFLTDLSGVDRTLSVTLEQADGKPDFLPSDDRADTPLPPRARPRILTVTRGNRYLEAALLLDEFLQVDTVDPDRFESADGYDLVIFDAVLPAAPPSVSAIYLAPDSRSGGAGPLVIRGDVERPFFERVLRDHPTVRGVALADTNIRKSLLPTIEPADRAIGSDTRAPLLVAGTRSGARFVALLFDVRESDLPMRTAWPLLLLNTVDWLTATNEPSGFELEGAALSTNETDIAPRAPRARIVTAPASRGSLLDKLAELPLWWLAVAFAIALLSVEWLLFQRRRTA
jgi:hypothetical protein